MFTLDLNAESGVAESSPIEAVQDTRDEAIIQATSRSVLWGEELGLLGRSSPSTYDIRAFTLLPDMLKQQKGSREDPEHRVLDTATREYSRHYSVPSHSISHQSVHLRLHSPFLRLL